MSIKCIAVTSCAACPFIQFHYGRHECSKMEFMGLPKQEKVNGKNTPIPAWCPLPEHPSVPKGGAV